MFRHQKAENRSRECDGNPVKHRMDHDCILLRIFDILRAHQMSAIGSEADIQLTKRFAETCPSSKLCVPDSATIPKL